MYVSIIYFKEINFKSIIIVGSSYFNLTYVYLIQMIGSQVDLD